MESFLVGIKEPLLTKVGTTLDAYNKVREPNKFGYDPVDALIIEASFQLERRERKVFGLLYDCHEPEEVVYRLKRRGRKKILISTVNRYRSAAENEVIGYFTEDSEWLRRLKEAVYS